MYCRGAVSMVLTLLCGMGDEWAKKLLQLLAPARRTGDLARFVFLQRYHNQRFFPAIEAFIVVHRHSEPPFNLLPKNHEWMSPLVQQGM